MNFRDLQTKLAEQLARLPRLPSRRGSRTSDTSPSHDAVPTGTAPGPGAWAAALEEEAEGSANPVIQKKRCITSCVRLVTMLWLYCSMLPLPLSIFLCIHLSVSVHLFHILSLLLLPFSYPRTLCPTPPPLHTFVTWLPFTKASVGIAHVLEESISEPAFGLRRRGHLPELDEDEFTMISTDEFV